MINDELCKCLTINHLCSSSSWLQIGQILKSLKHLSNPKILIQIITKNTEGVLYIFSMKNNGTFTIRLDKFEGPFDLLLFFIERDELDIYDIPIAKITNDFLEYIRQAELLNIDLASEFIVVAATLMRIKAKLLLPRKQLDEEGNEIDPREELVSRLLEYKRYKSVLDEMRQLEEERSQREERGNVSQELKDIAVKALVDSELENVTLYKLLKVFERLVRQYETVKNKPVHQIYTYVYSIESQRDYILIQLKENQKTDFVMLFGGLENRIHAIVTFLALLEMLNMQLITIIQGEGINNFWLSLPDESDFDESEIADAQTD